jgi:hypothetical protein
MPIESPIQVNPSQSGTVTVTNEQKDRIHAIIGTYELAIDRIELHREKDKFQDLQNEFNRALVKYRLDLCAAIDLIGSMRFEFKFGTGVSGRSSAKGEDIFAVLERRDFLNDRPLK